MEEKSVDKFITKLLGKRNLSFASIVGGRDYGDNIYAGHKWTHPWCFKWRQWKKQLTVNFFLLSSGPSDVVMESKSIAENEQDENRENWFSKF